MGNKIDSNVIYYSGVLVLLLGILGLMIYLTITQGSVFIFGFIFIWVLIVKVGQKVYKAWKDFLFYYKIPASKKRKVNVSLL